MTPTDELNPLDVFSDRAAIYRNRPQYPRELVDYLRARCGLSAETVIADIGAGTGYLTRLLLENGNRVYAVEPNAQMRAVCQEELGQREGLTCLEGQAEKIPLDNATVDMVTIGQALHWFEVEAARREVLRILRLGGQVVVVDKLMQDDHDAFMCARAALRRKYFRDIGTAAATPEKVVRLLAGTQLQHGSLPAPFRCGRETFVLGTLSSSLAPQPGTDAFERCKRELEDLFDLHQEGGEVTVSFEVVVWSGQFLPSASHS